MSLRMLKKRSFYHSIFFARSFFQVKTNFRSSFLRRYCDPTFTNGFGSLDSSIESEDANSTKTSLTKAPLSPFQALLNLLSLSRRRELPNKLVGYTQHFKMPSEYIERTVNLDNITRTFKELEKFRGNNDPYFSALTVTICDGFGTGKTLLAKAYATKLLNKRFDVMVGWLDCSGNRELIGSLRLIADCLNKSRVKEIDPKFTGRSDPKVQKEKLEAFSEVIRHELDISNKSNWLMVIDNLTPPSTKTELDLADYTPLKQNWGDGQILVTTRSLGLAKKYSSKIIDIPLSLEEAVQIAEKIGNVMSNDGELDKCLFLNDEEVESLLIELKFIHPFVSAVKTILETKTSKFGPRANYRVQQYLEEYKQFPTDVISRGTELNYANSLRVDQVLQANHRLRSLVTKLFTLVSFSDRYQDKVPIDLALRLAANDDVINLPLYSRNIVDVKEAIERLSGAILEISSLTKDADKKLQLETESVYDDAVEGFQTNHSQSLEAIKEHFWSQNGLFTAGEPFSDAPESVIKVLGSAYVSYVCSDSTAALKQRKLCLPYLESVVQRFCNLNLKKEDQVLMHACFGDALTMFETIDAGRKYLEQAHSQLEACSWLTGIKVKFVLSSAFRLAEKTQESKALLDSIDQDFSESSHLTPDLASDLLLNLGDAYDKLGWSDRACSSIQRGVEKLKTVASEDSGNFDVKRKLALAYTKLGRVQRRQMTDDFGEKNLLQATELLSKIETAGFTGGKAYTMTQLAKVYRDKEGSKQKAKDLFSEVLELEKDAYGKNHMSVAITYAHLSNLCRRMYNMEDTHDAAKFAENAEQMCSRLIGPEKDFHVGVGKCYAALASYHKDVGNLKDAEKSIDKALIITNDIYGKPHAKFLTRKILKASILRHQGKPREALEELSEVEKIINYPGVNFLRAKANLERLKGFVYRMLDEPKKAEKAFETAVEKYQETDPFSSQASLSEAQLIYLRRHANGAESSIAQLDKLIDQTEPVLANAFIRYLKGKVLLRVPHSDRMESLQAACHTFIAVHRKQIRHLGNDHPRLVIANTAIAAACFEMHEEVLRQKMTERYLRLLSLGLEFSAQAEIIAKKSVGEDHLLTAEALAHRGRFLRKLNKDLPTAFDCIKTALNIREKHLGKDHRKYAKSACSLGLTYKLIGERADAKKLLEEALKIFQNSREREASAFQSSKTSVDSDIEKVEAALKDL